MRLTDKVIKTVALPASGYRIEWDSELPGLGLRTTARGIKAFVYNYPCQGRSNFRPLRRSKNRPVGGSPAVFVGRLERSLEALVRAAQAEWKTAHKNRRERPVGQLERRGRFFLLCLRR